MNKEQVEMLTIAIHKYGTLSYRLGSLKTQDSRFLDLWQKRIKVMNTIRDYMAAAIDINDAREEKVRDG